MWSGACHASAGSIHKRFYPLDASQRVAGLSISPDGQSVAMRLRVIARPDAPGHLRHGNRADDSAGRRRRRAEKMAGRARRIGPAYSGQLAAAGGGRRPDRPNARHSCLCRANCRPMTPRSCGSIASPASVRPLIPVRPTGPSPESDLARDRLNPKLGSFSTTCGRLPGGCRRTRRSRATAQHRARATRAPQLTGPALLGAGQPLASPGRHRLPRLLWRHESATGRRDAVRAGFFARRQSATGLGSVHLRTGVPGRRDQVAARQRSSQ